MKVVIAESGRAFDPNVVEVLSRRYTELERLAQAKDRATDKLSLDLKIVNESCSGARLRGIDGEVPLDRRSKEGTADFLSSIAAARQEVQALFEISHDLGNSLTWTKH